MDSTEPPYNEKIGYNPAAFAIVPISGWHGDNMLEPITKMYLFQAWAKGERLTASAHRQVPASAPGNGNRSPAGGRAQRQRQERVRQGTTSWNCELAAQVIVLNHPGQISNGYTPVLDSHTAHNTCEIKEKEGDI
ncbi:elongation factor 1-alpha 2 [Culex quinquefasciatus]|uniref:Elongation factor 1-alpha 2 n=1 Tax=Culex quinquefasciatus TaxID=7176 RepID=B0XL03_CULQU|nr:elongation factor 1-alpha 2 [Culex quinquefasciatus]|eukprot:XP_001870325.1 elongation factor 1-alpha 2 [Culex quinquefasciatus]